MKKVMQDIELETPKEAKALGLRRISRSERPKVPQGMTLKNCQVISEIRLDADLFDYLETESKKRLELSVDRLLNSILREVIEKKKLREELLEDSEFVRRLREKLAA
jgi:hypothetical protein